MKLWQSLYLMIWLASLEILLVLTPFDFIPLDIKIGLHFLLGAVMIGLALMNVDMLQKSRAPDRLKRISRATLGFTVVVGAAGVLFFVIDYLNLDFLYWITLFVHAVAAITIISQASSTATGYDMWEEKEIGGPVEEKKVEPEPSAGV